MRFDTLHENLRLEIQRRIDRGIISGTSLAQATGFKQGHISNFLNRRRSLSLEGLDRVLISQKLSVLDLLPADQPRPSGRSAPAPITQSVPVVTHSAAALKPRMQPADLIDQVQVPDVVLHYSRERPPAAKALWQRFVAVRVDGLQAAAMEPLLRQDSTVIIDRHASTLTLYRSQSPPVFAVRRAHALHLCFLELDAGNLILRPRNPQIPVQLLPIAPKDQARDYITGRICYVLGEL